MNYNWPWKRKCKTLLLLSKYLSEEADKFLRELTCLLCISLFLWLWGFMREYEYIARFPDVRERLWAWSWADPLICRLQCSFSLRPGRGSAFLSVLWPAGQGCHWGHLCKSCSILTWHLFFPHLSVHWCSEAGLGSCSLPGPAALQGVVEDKSPPPSDSDPWSLPAAEFCAALNLKENILPNQLCTTEYLIKLH